MTDFSELDLIEPIQRAIVAAGYTKPTPIQARSIPSLLNGRDLLGVAQTGTGKTAAFVLPMLQKLAAVTGRPLPGAPRALILAPTRELAVQIEDSVKTYGRHLKLSETTVLGGVPINRQIKAVSRGVDVLVATPGRLLDLVKQGHVKLDRVEVFVLDEADRMLDMGFIHDVRRIAERLPKARQTVMFSATMPDEVAKLAATLLDDPLRVDVAPQSTPAERIDQRVFFVRKNDKHDLLVRLLDTQDVSRMIVFTRTKHGANKVARDLEKAGVEAGVIHGNKSQNARQAALNGFRDGRLRLLVATDIAARGIDVDDVSHVLNFDLPVDPESYVHRIGRTARAGRTGTAYSFCDAEERGCLTDIERTTREKVAVDTEHPYHDPSIANGPNTRPKQGGGGGGRNNGGFRGKGAPKGGQPKRFGGKPGNSNHRRGGRSGGQRRAA